MNVKTILQFSIGPIGAAALSLITLPFVAWFFSVEDVGRLTMVQLIISLSVSLFSLEMHQAYVREYHEASDKQGLLKMSIIPGLCLLIFTILIVAIIPFSISNLLFGLESKTLTTLLIFGLIATFFINFLAHVLRMQERGLAFSVTQIAPKIFLFILIGLILLIDVSAEFTVLMLINTLSILFSLFILAWVTRSIWLESISKNIDFNLLKKMLRFSSPLVAGGIAYWGLTFIDRLFLRHFSGFEELGIYSLSVAIAASVTVITSIFSSIWHPILYGWAKKGIKPEKVQRVIENMMLLVALVWSLFGLLSFTLPWFLPIEYAEIEYLIVACVAMPLFYLLSETTGVGIGITRRSNYSMLASISAFLVNVTLNFILIPDYGSSGAALASVFAFFIFFLIKTEASASLWCSFPRLKIYALVITYMIATTIIVLAKGKISNLYLIWILLLLLSCFFYFNRIVESFRFSKRYFRKDINVNNIQ